MIFSAWSEAGLGGRFFERNGTLRILARPWGNLVVDGEARGAVRSGEYTELMLPPGPHNISIKHPQMGHWQDEVSILSDWTEALTIDFNEHVSVTVDLYDSQGASVSAELFVDGASVGTFASRTISVAVGLHHIEARAEGYVQVKVQEIGPRSRDFEGAAPRVNFGPLGDGTVLHVILRRDGEEDAAVPEQDVGREDAGGALSAIST